MEMQLEFQKKLSTLSHDQVCIRKLKSSISIELHCGPNILSFPHYDSVCLSLSSVHLGQFLPSLESALQAAPQLMLMLTLVSIPLKFHTKHVSSS